jgi:hypothetical protein
VFRSHRRRTSSLAFAVACLTAGVCAAAAGAAGDGASSAQMKSLDEQVQEVKSDVLSIAAELSRLEEKLLYPSDTQVAIFVSLPANEKARLDSLQLRIDGELVAHHIYTWKELEALQKGGVQRVYTGNLPTGAHQLDVQVAGKLASGRDYSGTKSLPLEKSVGPAIVELKLAADELGGASIRVGND